ncbi:MAG: bifunctional 4-hydroxy-2-oxoglutarate aldolase/2-dehydro-3-deoxy-phosphogluconate aldolase [Steroidobacteraceae bacterium]
MAEGIAGILGISKVIPVVTLTDVAHAVPLADALLAGGIGIMELTLRTSGALAAIERLARDRPEFCVGGGTCRTAGDLQRVTDAGAAFAVSPGATAALIAAARRMSVPWLPGAATLSEMMNLSDEGYSCQKLFPAALCGGIELLKAVAPVLPALRFCPTGGVSPDNLAAFLAQPNVSCVGGSWIAPAELLQRAAWSDITRIAASAAGQAAVSSVRKSCA